MGQLERDAKKLARDLADDPANRQMAGWFWGVLIIGGIIGGITLWAVRELKQVPVGAWIALGAGLGVLGLAIALVVIANRRVS